MALLMTSCMVTPFKTQYILRSLCKSSERTAVTRLSVIGHYLLANIVGINAADFMLLVFTESQFYS